MKKQLLIYITLLCLGTFLLQGSEPGAQRQIRRSRPSSETRVGVKKYFAGIYNSLPIEDFIYYGTNSNRAYRPDNYWEQGKNSQGNMSGEFYQYVGARRQRWFCLLAL